MKEGPQLEAALLL